MFQSSGINENVGKLRISREVIVAIAKQAAIEVAGVHSLAKIPMDVKTYMQHKGIPAEVAVDLTDDVAVVHIALVLEAGHVLTAVVTKVQENVKEAIQSMTGVAVSKVHVIVEGMHFNENAAN